MIIIGIDPGMKGGIAWSVDRHCGPSVYCTKMPETETDTLHYLGDNIAACLGRANPSPFVYLEKVHSMPGQGVASTFKFGQGYGFLRGILVALRYPFEEVTPKKWQAEFGMKKERLETKSAWKQRLKGRAQILFPDLEVDLYTADALLIAEFGRRQRTL